MTITDCSDLARSTEAVVDASEASVDVEVTGAVASTDVIL